MRVNILLHSGILGISPGTGIYTAAMKFKEKLEKEGIDVDLNGSGYNYDIFHVHWPVPFCLPRIMKAKRKGIKVISHAHVSVEDLRGSGLLTSNDYALNFFGKYLNYFFNKTDLVIAPSSWAKENLIRRGIKRPVEVVSNGIDTREFSFNLKRRKAFREEHSIEDDDILVYCIGQLIIRKGIETFTNVAKKFPELKFFWIGKKILLKNAMMRMHHITNNLPENFNILGFVKDIIGAHCAGDIFLFPSFVENQGIAILEAAACSRAIVVRDLPVYDWAVNKKNCFVCKNDEEFVNSVSKLSKERMLRELMGKRVKKMSDSNDISTTIDKLVNIYDNVINS